MDKNIELQDNIQSSEHLRRRWFTNGATLTQRSAFALPSVIVNLVLYIFLCLFQQRINVGHWYDPTLKPDFQNLIPMLLEPLNVFQYPSYIFIVALMMAMLCVVPIIIALFYNIYCALPFVLVCYSITHNALLSVCLLISCTAISFEPLRFKSKFVAAVLCLSPEALYWFFYSGINPEKASGNVLRWAVLYSPWGMAFLFCLAIFGIVIAVGHFLRYHPGVLMPFFGALLATTVLLFHNKIGMAERDFLAEVYQHSPTKVEVFASQTIKPMLQEEFQIYCQSYQKDYVSNATRDEAIMQDIRWQWYLAFNPGVPAPDHITFDPDSKAQQHEKNITLARDESIESINSFIENHPESDRIADAKYYLALLKDMRVDIRALKEEDTLRLYCEVPGDYSRSIWTEILDQFGAKTVSLEARYRLAWLIASHEASNNSLTHDFATAQRLLSEAIGMCDKEFGIRDHQAQRRKAAGYLDAVFSEPPSSINDEQLYLLRARLEYLSRLLHNENRLNTTEHDKLLASFIRLDPHNNDYPDMLAELALNIAKDDPLADNIKYAQAMDIKSVEVKEQALRDLLTEFGDADACQQGRLELAKMLLDLKPENANEQADKLLQDLIAKDPKSFWARQGQILLERLMENMKNQTPPEQPQPEEAAEVEDTILPIE
ncbi:MAG: hypothetical protein JEZ07_20140 [Phycisphaerae bacterium]|nr:hypothetical protein [Phycisphaerae bacterium]